ncbi:hypothetical protein C8R43DRAFT_1137098 [Mycena crocata]|nr:hypothetical protein C8R43DRAFT_1137098 [Mycena crocata]
MADLAGAAHPQRNTTEIGIGMGQSQSAPPPPLTRESIPVPGHEDGKQEQLTEGEQQGQEPGQNANNTSIAIALPTIGAALHAQATTLQWLVSAYALSSGALLLLLFGHLADTRGLKRLFVFAARECLCLEEWC